MQTAKKRVFRSENLTVVTKNMKDYLENKRVLLVGANEVDEMLLRYMVVEHGGTLNVVTNAAALRQTLETSRYDLILMNARLGNENAIGILKHLREDHLIKAPVIAISSSDMVGRAVSQGFAYILHRPLEKKKMLQALNAVLQDSVGV